jgi:hypothetical protein
MVLPSSAKVYNPVHDAGLAGCSQSVRQLSAPTPEVKPGGHAVHPAAPASLNVPAKHEVQLDLPALL